MTEEKTRRLTRRIEGLERRKRRDGERTAKGSSSESGEWKMEMGETTRGGVGLTIRGVLTRG